MSRRAFPAALALLASAGCANPAPPAPAHYVALGSSYAAGTATGGIKPGTPERCGRSPLNYATLLATRLHLDLADASCGGAMTAHVLGPWDELPAQVSVLRPDTALVTLTVGGNDVAFVRNLFAASCDGAPGCATPLAVTEQDWAVMEAGLRAIVAAIRQRAPRARIVLVDYLTVVPPGRTCPNLKLDAAEARAAAASAARLAAATARVAQESGADLLPASRLSANHTACDPQPWSVAAPGSAPGTSWHPNAAGHAAVAAALAELLGPVTG